MALSPYQVLAVCRGAMVSPLPVGSVAVLTLTKVPSVVTVRQEARHEQQEDGLRRPDGGPQPRTA